MILSNRKNCNVLGMSTTCGNRKKFPIHENKLPPRNIPFHIKPCKHFMC